MTKFADVDIIILKSFRSLSCFKYRQYGCLFKLLRLLIVDCQCIFGLNVVRGDRCISRSGFMLSDCLMALWPVEKSCRADDWLKNLAF